MSNSLTDHDRKILDLITSGKTNAEIGQKLYVSEATAKKWIAKLFEKLGVSNREEAANWWASTGMTDEQRKTLLTDDLLATFKKNVPSLTGRQRQILDELVAQPQSSLAQIAAGLGMSENTLKAQLNRISVKLNIQPQSTVRQSRRLLFAVGWRLVRDSPS